MFDERVNNTAEGSLSQSSTPAAGQPAAKSALRTQRGNNGSGATKRVRWADEVQPGASGAQTMRAPAGVEQDSLHTGQRVPTAAGPGPGSSVGASKPGNSAGPGSRVGAAGNAVGDQPRRRSSRTRQPPTHLQDYQQTALRRRGKQQAEHDSQLQRVCAAVEPALRTTGRLQRAGAAVDAALRSLPPTPQSVAEALGGPHREHWEQAMQKELQNFAENNVFSVEELPVGFRPVTARWVFSLKVGPDGAVERFKARLVARGFTQHKGVDYAETFAPTCTHTSVRTTLAVAAAKDWQVDQLDVTAAYLQGELHDVVYMRPPEGCEGVPAGMAWRLHKAVYGLKQGARAWHDTLSEALAKHGVTAVQADPSVYVLHQGDGVGIMTVHVDDMLVTGPDALREAAKRVVMAQFKARDLGEAKHHLGLEIQRDREAGTLRVTQTQYARQVLERFGMSDCKPIDTPLSPAVKLRKGEGQPLDPQTSRYAEAVGSLMYLAVYTRPDLSHAVGVMSAPTDVHWTAVKRVLRYLRGTLDVGIQYGGRGEASEQLVLRGYADADWAGNPDTRRSTTGHVFVLNGGPISWCSKQQPTVAQSSSEAEYLCAASAIKEAAWLRQLLPALGVTVGGPVPIGVDNQSAIAMLSSPAVSARTKHIDVRHHLAREHVARGKVAIVYVPTEEQPADCLTKALDRAPLQRCCARLGLTAGSRVGV